jgi:hypothetical protein
MEAVPEPQVAPAPAPTTTSPVPASPLALLVPERRADVVLALQRTAGNRRVVRFLEDAAGEQIVRGRSEWTPCPCGGHGEKCKCHDHGPPRLARVALQDEMAGATDGPAGPLPELQAEAPAETEDEAAEAEAPAASAAGPQLQREVVTDRPQAKPGEQTGGGLTIKWRGSVRSSIFQFLRTLQYSEDESARITALVLAQDIRYTFGKETMTREEFDSRAHTAFALDRNLAGIIRREIGMDERELAVRAEIADTLGGLLDAIDKPRTRDKRSDEEEAREAVPVAAVSPNWAVLANDGELAAAYLRLMEHFGGLKLTEQLKSQAGDGLSSEELTQLVGTSRRLHTFTDLVTQGATEFKTAGGSAVADFQGLEERILEQFVWGNPTATRNQLMISADGWPERGQIGIVDRSSQLLYYDATATPLRSFAGGMWRDPGFVGAERDPDAFGLNIATIDDPVLKGFLNMLRHQITEPTRMVSAAAEMYFENVETVNSAVRNGLSEEVKKKFLDALPAFVGFLAGHALSSMLLRSPHPISIAVGGALKGLLIGAGYVMQIDFAGSAMGRLLEAATHISRIRAADDTGNVTELSRHHIEEGARPIRSMVADVALTAATIGLSALLGAIGGRGRATIECTKCRIKTREARTQSRQNARYEGAARFGLTRAQLDAIRRLIIKREKVGQVSGQGHYGKDSHFDMSDPKALATILKTINDPQAVLLAKNGNWAFYKNGTVVVTPKGNPSYVSTAFGSGAKVPKRRLDDLRKLYPKGGPGGKELQIGDPEPPVRLGDLIDQSSGIFELFIIWP